MQYLSDIKRLGQVTFPEFNSERVYMFEFFQRMGLPSHLKHWQRTIDQMLIGIQTNGPIYLMIDQGIVKAGTTQRRPGLHVDGYWHPQTGRHTPGHKALSMHLPMPLPIHGPSKPKPKKRTPKPVPMPVGPFHCAGSETWQSATFKEHEALILASDVTASRGFKGLFEGPVNDMGACEHVKTDGLEAIDLNANTVYAGNVTFLHESLPVTQDCERTLVRLNIPGLAL